MAPRAPLADPELFAIDTRGSTSVRNQVLTDFNQADRDGATLDAINPSETRIARRERERATTGVSKHLKRKLDHLAKRGGRGEGLWGVADARAGPGELSHAVQASGSYDAWTIDQIEAARQAALPDAIRSIVAPAKPKPPTSLHKHHVLANAAPQPIPLPHPGTSYNPTQSAHQSLLRSALTLAEAEEATRLVDAATKAKHETMKAADRGRELWEHAEMDVDRGTGNADDATSNGDEEPVSLARRAAKRKTEKAKRKAALNRKAELAGMKLRAREKRDKQLIASLPGVVRSLRRSTLDIDSRRAAHREAQRTALATRGLAGRRVGVARAPAERIDYQVGDELAEGLRTLKPEGNLWRDWQGSVTRRGKVEAPRLRTSEKRRAKTKTVEKHAWKRFE